MKIDEFEKYSLFSKGNNNGIISKFSCNELFCE